MKFLSYPRAIWLLVAGMAMQSAGNAFFWPFTTLYIHTVLGRSLTAAGLVLMAQSGASLVGAAVGGALFDRMGGRKTVTWGIVAAVVFLVLLAWVHNFYAYSVLVTGFGFSTGLIAPSMYAFSVSVWPEGGRESFNAVYVAQNLGVALGSIFGGLVAAAGGLRLTFLVNAFMLILFFVVVQVGYRGPGWDRAAEITRPPRVTQARRTGPLPLAPLLLILGLVLDWTAYVQWQTTTASYMHVEGYSLPLYSLLWTVNGAFILLGQPLMSWITERMASIKAQLLLGNVFFVVAYLIMFFTHRYIGYVAGMAFTTLGEMLVWPGVPAATDKFAPQGQSGLYQGFVSSAGAAGRMLGPIIGGVLYGHTQRPQLYGLMAFIYVASMVVFAFYDRGRRPLTSMVDEAL